MPVPTRRLLVRHATHYTYDRPVTRSVHRLHLKPISDFRQSLIEHKLTISAPTSPVIEYEDVFGSRAVRFDILEPYTELSIVAESTVEVADVDPFAFASVPIRPSFPLVWMPAERMMLNSYLQPVELPDTQLAEIYDYAMSFVERNNRDLMETLFAINLAIYREFKYAPGTTRLKTSAYDVMVRKAGVCQDFSNLFIAMARMLGLPARYVVGYIHTGNNGENRIGADATHAWVQIYIPNVGWKGFDPTNGTLPHLDHVRVAYGRHYRDTAPTSGTLYSPVIEGLRVDVEVRELSPVGGSTPPPSQKPTPIHVDAPEPESPLPAAPPVIGPPIVSTPTRMTPLDLALG